MLRMGRSTTGQLRPWSLPLHPRNAPAGRQVYQRWPSFTPERLLGAESPYMARLCGLDVLHTRDLLPSLGLILRFGWSYAIRAPRSDLAR